MKTRNKLNLFIMLLCFTAFLSCKSDDNGAEPDPEQEALEAYLGTWEATEVIKDDQPLEGYEQFTVTVSADKSMLTTGDPNEVFPTGSFVFVEGSNYRKINCDNTELTLSPTGTDLIVTFTIQGESSGGRVAGVDGSYEFYLQSLD